MAFDNYPPGAANDPRAPWNQKDAEMTEWEQSGTTKDECVCCGEIKFTDDEYTCEDCFVAQEIQLSDDDDGDRAYDSWKDDQL